MYGVVVFVEVLGENTGKLGETPGISRSAWNNDSKQYLLNNSSGGEMEPDLLRLVGAAECGWSECCIAPDCTARRSLLAGFPQTLRIGPC
jgi:hypothetical protein